MCGIAGSINLGIDFEKVVTSMLHRGPDEQAHSCIDNVCLVHSRLSIIDSIGGSQPMRRGAITVVYNGEIYNHAELREQFSLQCYTGSDTETFLAMYEKFGLDCMQYLDGMFAVALYDQSTKELLFIRDRAGEKPLYYFMEGDVVAFASELNTLRTIIPLDIDIASINQYLSTGFNFQSQTNYQNVFEVKPGHVVRITADIIKAEIYTWYSLRNDIEAHDSAHLCKEEALNTLDGSLHKAIKNRLLSSDLEVGCFLSGGIDSGLVTAIASNYTDNLKTFTVSFEGQFNEAVLASSVAKRYDTRHTTLNIDYSNLDKDIESILYSYGEPICDDSVIPSWYVSKAAKEHVTVVLTGDGADELFGGYRRYVPYALIDLFAQQHSMFHKAIGKFTYLPAPQNKMSRYNYAYRMAELLNLYGLERFLAAMVNVDTSELIDKQYNSALCEEYNTLASSELSSLKKMMLLDFESLLPGSLLPKMDIASMAHSLESRTPFFSDEVIAVSSRLPDQLKINGSTTKYLLRELARKYLPLDVVSAPKRGFEVPLVDWVDGTLRDPIFDTLNSKSFVTQFYNKGSIERLLASTGKVSALQRARTIWMLYTTELWARRHTKNAI